MKNKFLTGLATGLFLAGIAGISQATVYNPTTDFSITNGNPNGVWTYGSMPADLSTFHTDTVSGQ